MVERDIDRKKIVVREENWVVVVSGRQKARKRNEKKTSFR